MKAQLVRHNTQGGLFSEIFEAEEAREAFESRGFKFQGVERGHAALRPELQDQATYAGLLGPMWGGEGILRYETQGVYNQLST